MIDYHSTLVAALSPILPVYHEMTLTKDIKTPCISYMELSNVIEGQCKLLDYSRITYQVKVWGHDIGELQRYAQIIDSALRPLGWKRISCNEMYDRNSTMIQKILSYEGLVEEKY